MYRVFVKNQHSVDWLFNFHPTPKTHYCFSYSCLALTTKTSCNITNQLETLSHSYARTGVYLLICGRHSQLRTPSLYQGLTSSSTSPTSFFTRPSSTRLTKLLLLTRSAITGMIVFSLHLNLPEFNRRNFSGIRIT